MTDPIVLCAIAWRDLLKIRWEKLDVICYMKSTLDAWSLYIDGTNTLSVMKLEDVCHELGECY